MQECKYCGKPIARRKEKGGREREYCNDTCRELAFRARHPEKRYVVRIMHRIRREQWEKDPHLFPWQQEVETASRQLQQLQGEILHLEETNSMLSWDLHTRDEEIKHLRWKLADAEAEIIRLTVLLESQNKRKH